MQGTPERIAAGSAEEVAHAPWVWVGAEAVVIRGILRALHGHCITELTRGWTALERTACHLRHVQSMQPLLFYWPMGLNSTPQCRASNHSHGVLCFKCWFPTVARCFLLVLCLHAPSFKNPQQPFTHSQYITIRTPVAIRQFRSSTDVYDTVQILDKCLCFLQGKSEVLVNGLCRAYSERGVVDGWGLMHSLLADVVDDIMGAASNEASSAAAAERDAWTLIASLSTEVARDNCMGAPQPFSQCLPLVCQGALFCSFHVQ